MTRCNSLFVRLMLTGAAGVLALPGHSDSPPQAKPTSHPLSPAEKVAFKQQVARLPLLFESNQGQTDSHVRFLARGGDNTLFLTPSEAVFCMPSAAKAAPGKHKGSKDAARLTATSLRMQVVGANPKASPLAQQPQASRINYFRGKDPSGWHTNVPTYGRAGFHDVYPGVDLVYYGNRQKLEYDFVVAPHADPKQIKLHFDGAQKVDVNAAGDLVVRTADREMKWQKPLVYQQDATGKHSVAAQFRLNKLSNGQTSVGFALGQYDPAHTLIIDPVLTYSTYLRGTNSNGSAVGIGDYLNAIAVDSSGNAYVTGYTYYYDYPTTTGAFERSNYAANHTGALNFTAFVTKLNSTGTALSYSTFLGGTSTANSVSDRGNGIAVDGSGNAYIVGSTMSPGFPTTSGAFITTIPTTGSYNAFVTELNSTGSSLVYSTFLGGSSGSTGTAIAVANTGAAYVVGNGGTTFPVTTGAYQTSPASGGSGFFAKVNSSGSYLDYATYLNAGPTAIALGLYGDAYITGTSFSTGFSTTSGAYQTTRPAGGGFVMKFSVYGVSFNLAYSTYLGGSGTDTFYGIAVDPANYAYVVGSTTSSDFPTTSTAFQTSRPNASGSGFVSKLNTTGTGLSFSTYLGGTTGYWDAVTGVAVDNNYLLYVTGYAGTTDFPTTAGSYQRVKSGTGYFNAFVTRLNFNASDLIYSSYIGGTSSGVGDQAVGIGVDNSGNAFVAGQTNSLDYPTTSGAYQAGPSSGTVTHGFVTKLSTYPVFPDVNNDGYTDLLFQDTSNVAYAWYMNGLTVTAGSSISITPASGYKVVGSGDFNGDGKPDLLFQNTSTNALVIWYLNGAVYSSGTTISTVPASGYSVVGVADFNRDGKPDILFQNASTGQIVVWFMNGATFVAGQSIATSAPPVVGTGDFNQDGETDIVVQTVLSGGGIQVNVYYMNLATISSTSSNITFTTSGTRVLAVGDYNNDGYADLVLNDPSGTSNVYIQFMQDTTKLTSGAITTTPPSTYHVVGPH